MFRIACIGSVLVVSLVCGACTHDSRPIASNETYRGGEGVRFDANGNPMNDPSVSDHSRTGYADGDRNSRSSNRSTTDTSASSNAGWNTRNDRDANTRTWRDGQANRMELTRASWGDRTWNDSDVVMVNESAMPSPVRTSFSREGAGTTLSETGHGMWDGKQAYCAKFMKNGHPYKMITDADGNLLAMRRLD